MLASQEGLCFMELVTTEKELLEDLVADGRIII
jgi:hypothetical protein